MNQNATIADTLPTAETRGGCSLQRVFGVIYADPPWRYDSGTVDPTRKIENHYPTMDIKDICAIRPPAAKDCVLYMWATAPQTLENNQSATRQRSQQ